LEIRLDSSSVARPARLSDLEIEALEEFTALGIKFHDPFNKADTNALAALFREDF
jgi:hypothetical protein